MLYYVCAVFQRNIHIQRTIKSIQIKFQISTTLCHPPIDSIQYSKYPHLTLYYVFHFKPARPYSKFEAILLTLYPHRNYNVNHAFENGKQFYYVKDERK